MKRLLAILLCIIQFSGFVYVKAEVVGENTSVHAKALTALGIIDELDEKAFSVNAPITRKDFVRIISGLVNYKNEGEETSDSVYYRDVSGMEEIAQRVDYLTDIGFVSGYGDGLFHPEKEVKTVDVIVVLAKILGYDTMAKHYGGYPAGYVKALRDSGVKFTLGSNDQTATGAQVTELVYQVLDEKMLLSHMNGEVYSDEDVTILSTYHGIETDEGVVTAVEYFDEDKKGNIIINENVYEYLHRDIEQWLGLDVKYFYNEDDRVIYLEKNKRNKITDLDAVQIENIEDGKFSYYTSKISTRTVSKKIGASVDYIYNGVRVKPQLGEDMNKYIPMYEGNVRLIDNNSDDVIDYIIIMDYDTFIVNDLNSDDCVYYDKYTQRLDKDGKLVMQEPLDLGSSDVRFAHITDALTGVYLERSDITKGAVLSVAKSLDKSVVHIIVSGNSVTGTVTEASYDDKGRRHIVIDAKDYIISKVYSDFKGNIPTGITATFSLTSGNLIADFDISSDYAYLIDAREYEADGEEGVYFRIYTPEGNFERVYAAKKMTINQYTNVEREDIIERLKNGDTEVEPGVVIIEKNSEGMLRKIYTKDAQAESEKRINLRSCFSTSPQYDANLSVFFNSDVGEIVNQNTKNIGGKLMFDDNTILFDIPESPKTADESEFGASLMSSYAHFTYIRDIEVYNSDEKSLASDVIVRKSTGLVNIVENQEAVLISKIDTTLDELGDVVTRVRGYRVGKPVTYIADSTDKLMAQRLSGKGEKVELGVGDIARFTFANNGRISASEILIDASREGSSKIMQNTGDAPNTSYRFNHGFRLQKAKVYRKERGHLVITRENLTDTENRPLLPSTYELMPTNAKTHCWLIDFSAGKKVEEFNLLDLKDYLNYGTDCDEVYIYQRESAYDILIIK